MMRKYFAFAAPCAALAVGGSAPAAGFAAAVLSLSSSFSASSAVILPAANISNTFFLSSDMTRSPFERPAELGSSVGSTKSLQGFFHREFSAGQLLQNVEIRRRVCKILIQGRGDRV